MRILGWKKRNSKRVSFVAIFTQTVTVGINYVLGGRGLVGLRSPPCITYSFCGRLRIPLGTDSFCHQAGKRYDAEKVCCRESVQSKASCIKFGKYVPGNVKTVAQSLESMLSKIQRCVHSIFKERPISMQAAFTYKLESYQSRRRVHSLPKRFLFAFHHIVGQ